MKTAPKPINRVQKYGPGGYWYPPLTPEEQDTLRQLAHSKNLDKRKRCAEWLKEVVSIKANHPLVLELADVLIPDRNRDIRWGILTIALCPRLYEWDVSELWPLVIKWGSVENTDIRNAVGVCVLEHILESDFQEYFGRAKRLIEGGNKRFAYTLACCGKFGQAVEANNSAEFDAFFASLPPYPFKAMLLRPSRMPDEAGETRA